MPRLVLSLALLLSIVLANESLASIQAQVGSLGFGTVTNSEDFESFSDFEFVGEPFSTASGFTFDMTDASSQLVIWSNDGAVGFNTRSLYQNGGADSMTHIALTSGADFEQIEFAVGHGFAGDADPHNVWIRAYNDGVATGDDFILSVPFGGTITVWTDNGTPFDEIRVQSYGGFAVLEDEAQGGSVSIDNVRVGTFGGGNSAVPEPSTVAMWTALGAFGLVIGRRRLKRSAA